MSESKDQNLKIDADLLRENQASDAAFLKEQQETTASDLTNIDGNRDSAGNSSIEDARVRAALALNQSQNTAAMALKTSHEDHAKILKRAQQSTEKKIKEKNSFISWMTGGYSVENEEE